MICAMHEAEPRGYLRVGDRDVTEADVEMIARIASVKPPEARKALAELRIAGVYSVSESGVIYSRRIVREETQRSKDRENGRLGGNPSLIRMDIPGVNPPDKPRVNPPDKPRVNPPDNGQVKAHSAQPMPESNVQPLPSVEAGAVAPPQDPLSRPTRPATEPFGFADWLFDQAIELGIIGEHRQEKRDQTVRSDLAAAKQLLAAYGLEECQIRARRLLHAIVTGKLERTLPTVRALAKAWEYGCVVRDEEPAPPARGRRGVDSIRFGYEDPADAYDGIVVRAGGQS